MVRQSSKSTVCLLFVVLSFVPMRPGTWVVFLVFLVSFFRFFVFSFVVVGWMDYDGNIMYVMYVVHIPTHISVVFEHQSDK